MRAWLTPTFLGKHLGSAFCACPPVLDNNNNNNNNNTQKALILVYCYIAWPKRTHTDNGSTAYSYVCWPYVLMVHVAIFKGCKFVDFAVSLLSAKF